MEPRCGWERVVLAGAKANHRVSVLVGLRKFAPSRWV